MEIRSNMPSLLKMDIGKMKSMKLDVQIELQKKDGQLGMFNVD